MATAAVLTERAESLGLPITKNAFEGTLENPVPSLPYMVYLLPREATAGADSRPNNLMADDWQLELYTVADDEAAEEIRTRIENEVCRNEKSGAERNGRRQECRRSIDRNNR